MGYQRRSGVWTVIVNRLPKRGDSVSTAPISSQRNSHAWSSRASRTPRWSATIFARRSEASKTGPSGAASSSSSSSDRASSSDRVPTSSDEVPASPDGAPASGVSSASSASAASSASTSSGSSDTGEESPGMNAGSNPAPVTGSPFRGWLLGPMHCSTAGSMVHHPVPGTAAPDFVIRRLHEQAQYRRHREPRHRQHRLQDRPRLEGVPFGDAEVLGDHPEAAVVDVGGEDGARGD